MAAMSSLPPPRTLPLEPRLRNLESRSQILCAFHRSPNKPPLHTWTATILKVDRFGNLITNLHIDDFAAVKTRPFELRIAGQRIHRLALTYSDTEIGELSVLAGSSGYIEVAANQAPACKALGCGSGASLELEIFYD